MSVRLSVHPSAWSNSTPTRRISIKFDIWGFFENLSRKLNFHQNVAKMTGILHEGQYTFSIKSRSVLLIVRNVPSNSYRRNQNTHIELSNFFFPPKECSLCDNVENYCRAGHATNDNMARARITCWKPKATNTHSSCVILIALPSQKWLHEHASILRYTHIAYLHSIWALKCGKSVKRSEAAVLKDLS